MTPYRLYLKDEAPRIGSGWRVVNLVRLGPKWATVKSAYGPRVTKKFRRSVWDKIATASTKAAIGYKSLGWEEV